MVTVSTPQTPPGYDQTRILERPDGFYWQDKLTGETVGPFHSLLEAVQDMQSNGGNGYGEGETLEQAEDEIGLADWTDPETGEPAEDTSLHLSDE